MARPWTTDDDALLREHVGNGLSIAKTAEAMGRARSSVEEHAKALGLSWSRPATPEATQARKDEERARRARFRDALMADLEHLREELWAPMLVHSFGGRENTYAEHTLNQPPVADQLRLVQAMSAGIATLERLEKMDSDEGITDAAGMLDGIAGALKLAAIALSQAEIDELV